MSTLESLKNITLAPYIVKAMPLIWVRRRVGGNQFRHSFATLGILIDYNFIEDPVLLKAALLHDLFEEKPETELDDVRHIDQDGPGVVALVLEVTRRNDETKEVYLNRVLQTGSRNAMILKCVDRISNLTDLTLDTHERGRMESYLDQTEMFIIPMAEKVNENLVIELTDLVKSRRAILGKRTE